MAKYDPRLHLGHEPRNDAPHTGRGGLARSLRITHQTTVSCLESRGPLAWSRKSQDARASAPSARGGRERTVALLISPFLWWVIHWPRRIGPLGS